MTAAADSGKDACICFFAQARPAVSQKCSYVQFFSVTNEGWAALARSRRWTDYCVVMFNFSPKQRQNWICRNFWAQFRE